MILNTKLIIINMCEKNKKECINLKYGFSQCNFPHMDMFQCIEFAKSNGFDFLETYWEHVTDTIINDGEKFADVLKKSGLNLTIHHALLVEKRTDEFERSILAIKDWYDKYGLLNILSFDTWVNRTISFKHLLWVLELFKDTKVKILTEDYPVLSWQLERWAEVKKYNNYGLLLDIGHMNLRLCDNGEYQPYEITSQVGEAAPLLPCDNSPEAFYNALKNKPLPIYQIHVHNNDGIKDCHDSILNGTANYEEIIKILYKLEFDGFVDFELVPELHNKYGAEAEKMLLEDFEFWKNIRRNVKENEKEE